MNATRNPLIIGAGPAGLTAALELTKRGVTPRLYEATSHVGGLARTPRDGDWRVDPGGHRFFTRNEQILDLWNSLLPPEEWISVPRRSAMLVAGRYVPYPLAGRDLVKRMGLRSGMRGAGSLAWSRFRRSMRLFDRTDTFREWGIDEFGRHWYDLFFDGYVRKTWLADPNHLTSDWANQRIKPIDWRRADVRLADRDVFRYPRLGPGQLWEAASAALTGAGVTPTLNSTVVAIRPDGRHWTVELQNGDTVAGDAVFSSMPLRLLINSLEPEPPKYIRAIADTLRHRSVITVAVALEKHYDIPFNWVYTPGREFRVGRIQNYGRWSSALAPQDWGGTHLGLEYFTLPNDDMWIASEESLGAIVEQDLRTLGVDDSALEHVMIVRSQFAYPIYDPGRERNVARIRDYLKQNHPTMHPIGRNGMHRYDNQDHAMLSAMHSVAQYFGENIDPWRVNTELGYHEAGLLKN
ncbi:UDP-galactopyranose mutase [Mycolicibacterium aurum]|uniref:UDP-galactopyranose mutase n=1 Tax=Mycolicibacterium aurum TaxID=1791 RepID=A0A3S4SFR7_MYCAU|nr:NAD(P)/FAD-dependent oxidoreductase [Mycolicibacterium aurum]VEG52345.1 UDP-galactopyranose mutase [Mycolicibacterium aurum]